MVVSSACRTPSADGLDVALDVGERSAEFVGDVGHQITALQLRALEFLRHGVERFAELSHVVSSRGRNAL